MPPQRYRLEQLAAAVGVILSLIFVGYEIRQNTKVARAAAVQATTEQIIQWSTEMVTDPEWVRIMTVLQTEGGRWADLSPEDRTRYSWVVANTLRMTENRFRQMQMGVIREADLGISGGTSNTDWFRSQHMLDWWQSQDRSGQWAPDFVEFFETEILGIRG